MRRALSGIEVVVMVAALGCGGSEGGGATVIIGEEGGSVELGRLLVTVPAGLVPEPVEVSVQERSPLQGPLGQDLGSEGYRAVGPAYEIRFPFCGSVPVSVSLSYAPEELPTGFAASDLAMFLYSDVSYESGPTDGDPPTGLSSQGVVLAPSEVVEADTAVRSGLYCDGTVQLVAMAEPARVVGGPAALGADASIRGEAQPKLDITLGPFVILLPSITQALDDQAEQQVIDELRAGLTAAHRTLVTSKGFPAPPLPSMTMIARRLPAGTWGRVMPKYPNTIEIDPLQAEDLIQSVVAHELFHTIQNWNTNRASILGFFLHDRWLREGTAEWARDEVLDSIAGHYQAPTAARFTMPLNRKSAGISVAGEDFLYETVAFWKWLESAWPHTILSTVLSHREMTRECHPSDPNRCRESLSAISYVASLESVLQSYAGVDLVDFFTQSLYWKRFETDEVGTGDLWDYLGKPMDLQFTFFGDRNAPIELRKGGDGDGKGRAKDVDYSVVSHLTADAILVTNGSGPSALSGTLHVKLHPSPSHEDLVAVVIDRDSATERRIVDLSSERETTLSFGPGSEVTLIIVDPKLESSSSDRLFGFASLWVEEGCGQLPSNIIDVSNTQELLTAVQDAPSGSAIRLAAGTYSLPRRLWDGSYYAGLYVRNKDLTFVGSGPEPSSTTLSYSAGDGSAIWTTQNSETVIRDLSISANGEWGIYAPGVRRLSLCNVAGTFSGVYSGAEMIPWASGTAELEVRDTTWIGPGGEYSAGFLVDHYAEVPPTITVRVNDSEISSWHSGISYSSGPFSAPTIVQVDDCTSTFSDTTYNVLEITTSDWVERCP